MPEGTKTFVGHRVHIRSSDGKIITRREFRCHIANGTKYFSEPPNHNKFYTEQGELIELDQVPDVCKRHLAKEDVKPVLHKAQEKSSKKLEGSKPADGDSLI